MRTLLCIDVSYQSYRAAAAHPMLTSRRIFTGGLYGFFASFAKMMRETRATDVAFCMDTKPYWRSESYPEYKQLRKSKADPTLRENHETTMKLIRAVLIDCGLKLWSVPGAECDDLIAHCVMKYRGRWDRIYAASNDSDLYQLLLAPNFAIYKKGIADVVTGRNLVDAFGKPLAPDEYMLMTALTGTHNDIAGIPGVGPTTALKAIREPAVMRKLRDQHGEIIDRNLALIKLPHKRFPYEEPIPAHHGSFQPRRLYSLLGDYDIDCTGAMVNAFEQLLER